MNRQRLKIFLALIVSSLCLSYAQMCVNVQDAEATGYGIAGADSDTQFRQALSEALASAVAQTSGLFINRKTELTEIVRSIQTGDDYSSSESSEFSQTVVERLSGTILSYEVLSNTTSESGLQGVTIRATLCLDQRIVLNLLGSREDIITFSGQLRSNVTGAGWQISALTENVTIRDARQGLEVALASGATLILDGQLTSSEVQGSQDTTSVIATLSATLFDTKSLDIVASFELSGNGIGYTLQDAKQDALSKLSSELANKMSIKFLESSDRQKGIIIIKNITRSGNRFTLGDLAAETPGVIAVNDASYEESSQTVKLDLDVSASLCDIADALTNNRRIIMRLDDCGDNSAELTAIRD
jgi:hypothetical protein